MLENLSNRVTTISSNTQVVFTMKNFSALIGGMLALFFGFYQLVVVPKIQTVDEQLKIQIIQNQFFQAELSKINSSINTLNLSVQGLTQKNVENTHHINLPTGGQFEMSFYQTNIDSLELKDLLVQVNNGRNLLQNHSIP